MIDFEDVFPGFPGARALLQGDVQAVTAADLRAAAAGAKLIGVNNRDLTTFKVDLETSIRLAQIAPSDAILVSESGIATREDIQRLQAAGYHAFLIGEHFMRQKDVGVALRELVLCNE